MRIGIAAADRVAGEALRRALGNAPEHTIAWSVVGGAECIASCRRDPPQLLLLDAAMESPDAPEITRVVMGASPCKILLVTADREATVHRLFLALEQGALDVVAAPSLDLEGTLSGHSPLLKRLALVAKIDGLPRRPAPIPPSAVPGEGILVAIGASTGGPQALSTLLSALPAGLEASVLVVQHIDAPFAAGLASWLQERARFTVTLAANGDLPTKGVVRVAAADQHLVLTREGRLAYVAEPAEHPHRPSVDVFFESLAAHGSTGIAALLTGMGRDGADGLLKLRQRGWTTIAQDERTSAVYGMPRAAAELGAADHVLPIEAIGPMIAGLVSRLTRRH